MPDRHSNAALKLPVPLFSVIFSKDMKLDLEMSDDILDAHTPAYWECMLRMKDWSNRT